MVGLRGNPMTKSLKTIFGAALAFALLSLAGDRPAQAAVLTVTATVTGTCTIAAATLNFATGFTGTTAVDSQQTLTVVCLGATIRWDLNADGGSSGSVADRRMTHGSTDSMKYQLYTDTPGGSVWGDGTAG